MGFIKLDNVMKKRKTEDKIIDTIVIILMVLIVTFCFVPFIYIFALSFSSAKAVINNRVFLWPVGFNIDSYMQILTYPKFFLTYKNTIFYTVFGTMISLAMCVMFAYPLSKKFLFGRSLILKFVIFTMFFGGGLIPTFMLISGLGLRNTVFAMLIPYAISPFNLIILINFMSALPNEIEEAAIMDGLNYFGILRKIVLPLSLPALATIGLFVAVFFWNDWFLGSIYLKPSQYPVMLTLRNIVSGEEAIEAVSVADSQSIGLTVKSAAILTTTLPIIILYPFLQRFFVKGLTVGSVKG